MASSGQTVRAYFRILTVIHAAMLLGMLLFALVSVFIVRSGSTAVESAPELERIMMFAVPLLALAGILSGFVFFRTKLSGMRQLPDLKEKLKVYRTVQIIRYAMLEAPVLFVIVAYLLTGIALYLYLAFVLLFLFVLFRPGRSRAVNDLELSANDKKLLDDPDYRLPQI